MVLSHCILYKDREKELSGEAVLGKSPEEIEIRHGGVGKFFGTLISFFRSLISFFRSFISFFRTFISALCGEFSFPRELLDNSSLEDGIKQEAPPLNERWSLSR